MIFFFFSNNNEKIFKQAEISKTERPSARVEARPWDGRTICRTPNLGVLVR